MKVLMGFFWIAAMATNTYGAVHAIPEESRETGRSVWRILISGEDLFIWHAAPGWYYPTLITLMALAFLTTIGYLVSEYRS